MNIFRSLVQFILNWTEVKWTVLLNGFFNLKINLTVIFVKLTSAHLSFSLHKCTQAIKTIKMSQWAYEQDQSEQTNHLVCVAKKYVPKQKERKTFNLNLWK